MRIALLLSTALLLATPAIAQTPAPSPATVQLPMHIGGRAVPDASGRGVLSQWPGIYYEASFNGTGVTVRLNDAVNHLRIYIDGKLADEEQKPGEGDIDFGPLTAGPHTIRLQKISESQGDSAADFPGFFVTPGVAPLPAPPPRTRQIEFIGDSYTVGYGNTSSNRTCTQDQIWATTDTSQAFGPLTAQHYNADYQINAISGHGMVRNYNGSPGDPVPVAYPFVLFDKLIIYKDAGWQPQVIVIGLGTNDFTTPLNPGEKWKTRDELHADYEKTYIAFVQSLRVKNPKAYFILMATDQVNGEIQSEAKAVLKALRQKGESRIDFLPMNTLSFTGCDWHPSTADDTQVSQSLISFIDNHPDIWPTP